MSKHYVIKYKRGSKGNEIKPGSIFGDLIIIRRLSETDVHRKDLYLAECLCGRKFNIDTTALRTGRIACSNCEKKYKRAMLERSREKAGDYAARIKERWQAFCEQCRTYGCATDTTYESFKAELMSDPDFLAGDSCNDPPARPELSRDYRAIYSGSYENF